VLFSAWLGAFQTVRRFGLDFGLARDFGLTPEGKAELDV